MKKKVLKKNQMKLNKIKELTFIEFTRVQIHIVWSDMLKKVNVIISMELSHLFV